MAGPVSSHQISVLIEVVLCVMPFLGVPLLCWWDPAHLVEKKREEAQR